MAREIGKVVKIEDGWMEIKVPTGDGCGTCSSKSKCTFHGPDSAYRYLKARHETWISQGDRITLEVPDSARNLSALIVFVLPIILVAAGIAVATTLLTVSYREVLGVLGGFLLYGLALYLANRWLARSDRFLPRVVSVDKSANSTAGAEIPDEASVTQE